MLQRLGASQKAFALAPLREPSVMLQAGVSARLGNLVQFWAHFHSNLGSGFAFTAVSNFVHETVVATASTSAAPPLPGHSFSPGSS